MAVQLTHEYLREFYFISSSYIVGSDRWQVTSDEKEQEQASRVRARKIVSSDKFSTRLFRYDRAQSNLSCHLLPFTCGF